MNGPELDISPPRRERNQGRESRAQEQRLRNRIAVEQEMWRERLSEIVIHTPVSRENSTTGTDNSSPATGSW